MSGRIAEALGVAPGAEKSGLLVIAGAAVGDGAGFPFLSKTQP